MHFFKSLNSLNFFPRIGRKVPLMIAVVLQSATGLLSAFVPWYELFLVLKFVAALATGGTMLISFVIGNNYKIIFNFNSALSKF